MQIAKQDRSHSYRYRLDNRPLTLRDLYKIVKTKPNQIIIKGKA